MKKSKVPAFSVTTIHKKNLKKKDDPKPLTVEEWRKMRDGSQ